MMNRIMMAVAMWALLPLAGTAQCPYDIVVQRDTQNALLTTYTTDAPFSDFSARWTVGALGPDTAAQSLTVLYQQEGVESIRLILEDTANGSCIDTITRNVPICAPCVVPGDLNYNGVVNHKDLLSIGLRFNSVGPVRNDTGQQDYIEKVGPDWNDTVRLPSGQQVNTKLLDADGNGSIEALDTVPILSNYGYEHGLAGGFSGGITSSCFGTGSPLYMVPRQDTIEAGEVLEVDIFLGRATNPATNTLGLGFSIGYDSAMIRPNSSRIFIDPDTGQPAFTPPIRIDRDLFSLSRTDASFVHLNGIPVDYDDYIGTFITIIDDDIVQSFNSPIEYRELDLIIRDPLRVDGAGNRLNVCGENQKVTLFQRVSSLPDPTKTKGLKLYPNPAGNRFYLHIENEEIRSISLISLLGQEIAIPVSANGLQIVETAGLSAGVYVAKVRTNAGKYLKKVVIRR